MARRTIQPESTLSISLKQALMAAAVIAAAGLAYGSIVWTQSIQTSDIQLIKVTTKEQEDRRTKMAEQFLQLTKEQSERRETMGKEFLASNREIVTRIGELTTALAVQQAQSKTTSEALAKISDQLGTLTRQLPQTPSRR